MIKSIMGGVIAVGLFAIPASATSFPEMTLDSGDVVAVTPLPPRRGHGGSVYAIISNAARRHGVPERLAHAVIHVESKHHCGARNRSGAAGLGQLMPGTARSLGVRNTMDCAQNAEGAMRYLGRFYQQSGGNWCAAATAYNRGSLGGCSGYGRKVVHTASR